MPRKTPFSGKQKKKQLQEKKIRKQAGPRYADSDNEEDTQNPDTLYQATTQENQSELTEATGGASVGESDPLVSVSNLEVQKINQQPLTQKDLQSDVNSFRLHFFKETDEVLKKRKKEARRLIKFVDQKYLEQKFEDVYPLRMKLDFPKRPPWNYSLSKDQLEAQEHLYFQKYVQDMINQPRAQDLSYFELNLETWRQLWRVLEISDILLFIADIRYPVLHLPRSLMNHVINDLHKHAVIILNKVDFVPAALALAWKRYIESVFPEVHVIFFSSYPRDTHAADAVLNFDPSKAFYKRPFQGNHLPVGPRELYHVCKGLVKDKVDLSSWADKLTEQSDLSSGNSLKMSSVSDKLLEDKSRVHTCDSGFKDGILTIGCIGYPNVGKSSVLNALVNRKVVSVSKTPGHTKHLQTIFLSPSVRLCDCPGLVFPSVVPKSLQVIAGIFPVAQVREPYSVIGYLAKRVNIPRLLQLQPPGSSHKKQDKNIEEIAWSAFDICDAWAIRKGFTTSKAGRPDTYRAANQMLRLAVDGSICLCFKPPHYEHQLEQILLDAETKDLAQLLISQPQRKRKSSEESFDDEEGSDNEEEDVSADEDIYQEGVSPESEEES